MSLLAATAVVTALVGLPTGVVAPPPGSVPVGAHVEVLDRQLGIVSVQLPERGSKVSLARLRAAAGVRYATVPALAGGLAATCFPQSPASSPHPTAWRKTVSLSTHSADGFTVGIPDTGADLGRLGGTRDRLVTENFTTGKGVGDTVGHGTEVASLIAASRSDLGVSGVAPDVGLAIARIANNANCDPGTLARNLISAFRWFRQIGDVQIVNVSSSLVPDEPLVASLHALQQSGTLVVAAAGNDEHPGKTTFPASEPHVVGVGALDSPSKIWRDSARGPFVDLVAPAAGSGVIESSGVDSDLQATATGPGTSFAAPIVTGAAALVWAKHPAWDASRVAAALMLSATHLSGARPNDVSGFGRLNVKAALAITPAPDLDEPNDWASAARGLTALAHGVTRHATIGGDDDPLDAYPLTAASHTSVQISGRGTLHAYLLRATSIGKIDPSVRAHAVSASSLAKAAPASAIGRTIRLKLPSAGSWYLVVTGPKAGAPVGYSLRVG